MNCWSEHHSTITDTANSVARFPESCCKSNDVTQYYLRRWTVYRHPGFATSTKIQIITISKNLCDERGLVPVRVHVPFFLYSKKFEKKVPLFFSCRKWKMKLLGQYPYFNVVRNPQSCEIFIEQGLVYHPAHQSNNLSMYRHSNNGNTVVLHRKSYSRM